MTELLWKYDDILRQCQTVVITPLLAGYKRVMLAVLLGHELRGPKKVKPIVTSFSAVFHIFPSRKCSWRILQALPHGGHATIRHSVLPSLDATSERYPTSPRWLCNDWLGNPRAEGQSDENQRSHSGRQPRLQKRLGAQPSWPPATGLHHQASVQCWEAAWGIRSDTHPLWPATTVLSHQQQDWGHCLKQSCFLFLYFPHYLEIF